MLAPDEIAQALFEPRGPLAGKRFVVTAGPTREPLDPVRFIGNRSSGKMGFAVAAELVRTALDDLAAFWLNPVMFGRTLALCGFDLAREVWQALRQRARNQQPRLPDRFPSLHTLLRPIANVLLREMAAFSVMREIQRGSPIIYATFVGYDVVAHHAGPDTTDALSTLRGFDRHLRHIRQVVRYLAPLEYDLFILSDHGQSAGATFRQRNGVTLRELIDRHTRREVRVGEAVVEAGGVSFVQALLDDLNTASEAMRGQKRRRIRRTTMRATARALERITPPSAPADGSNDIVVCASGCLAHVYFPSLSSTRAARAQIEASHLDLLDALIQHPGIGFVVVCEDGAPVALGRGGARHLVSGRVVGADPLAPFGEAAARAAQLRRLAQFENSGDVIVHSALFPDGSVAAFEELIGSHGGLGGEQTEAFIVHPCLPALRRAPIHSAAHLFAVLDEWRRRCAIPASGDT